MGPRCELQINNILRLHGLLQLDQERRSFHAERDVGYEDLGFAGKWVEGEEALHLTVGDSSV
jgi:hypothetical protein